MFSPVPVSLRSFRLMLVTVAVVVTVPAVQS